MAGRSRGAGGADRQEHPSEYRPRRPRGSGHGPFLTPRPPGLARSRPLHAGSAASSAMVRRGRPGSMPPIRRAPAACQAAARPGSRGRLRPISRCRGVPALPAVRVSRRTRLAASASDRQSPTARVARRRRRAAVHARRPTTLRRALAASAEGRRPAAARPGSGPPPRCRTSQTGSPHAPRRPQQRLGLVDVRHRLQRQHVGAAQPPAPRAGAGGNAPAPATRRPYRPRRLRAVGEHRPVQARPTPPPSTSRAAAAARPPGQLHARGRSSPRRLGPRRSPRRANPS